VVVVIVVVVVVGMTIDTNNPTALMVTVSGKGRVSEVNTTTHLLPPPLCCPTRLVGI